MSDQEQVQLSQRVQLDEMLQHIEDMMAEDQYDQAQSVLVHALKYELFDLRVYQRYAFVLRMMGNTKAAELYEAVAMNPTDPEGYYKVARSLMENNMFGSAINPLRKVVEIVPMATNVIFELGYAYLKESEFDNALQFFGQTHEMEPTPNSAYYLAYTNLMLNNLEAANSYLPYIEEEYVKIGQESIILNILKAQIERYEAFPPTTVRDWHFVQYGTPLLRVSNQDLEESGNLNGRYVFINYGFGNVAYVLKTLQRLIKELPNFPAYDYILPVSFKAAPIGFALSQMLQIPLAPKEALESDKKGLVVTSWTDQVDIVAQHVVENPNVSVFSFSLGWTMQAAICPEFVGYLDQANRLPWEETVMVNEEGERRTRPAMDMPPEVIGFSILERVEQINDSELDEVVDYYKARAHLLKVGENINFPRLGFQMESPVQSLRMMV